MNWNELSEKIDKLTPKQRKLPVKVWGENISLADCSIKEEVENIYTDTIYPSGECFYESDLFPNELKSGEFKKVLDKGTPYIWID